MKIIGFSFTKISVEKFNEINKELKVNTNIDISTIKELKSNILKTKEELLGVNFTFTVNYEPNFAKIITGGNLIVSVEPKLLKEILKQWENKKMPEDFKISLFNIILRKSSLKTFQLEDEMNLPLHLPMGSFRKEDK